MPPAGIQTEAELETAVRDAVRDVQVLDIHTHLYPPGFGDLLLWGVDDLLTYHYLIAEVFRVAPVDLSYEAFFAMPKTAQAELIWKHLFLDRAPLSEACRGVITTLARLGMDPEERDLSRIRKFFSGRSAEQHVDHVFTAAGVHTAIMTNNPFDADEVPHWDNPRREARFQAALRIDDLLLSLERVTPELTARGYNVSADLRGETLAELRRFLTDWIDRIHPWYVAASLGPDYDYPGSESNRRFLDEALLPVCRDRGLPLGLMVGVRRGVNPRLGLAGDGVGRADPAFIGRLCETNPDNKFLVTMLSRENQHELCVLARKFRNLHVFGCWWFVNNPSIVHEITAERLELLGLSFTPQHSDARVLDQIAYKWAHSRSVIADVLVRHYKNLHEVGYRATVDQVNASVEDLFGGSFRTFVGRS